MLENFAPANILPFVWRVFAKFKLLPPGHLLQGYGFAQYNCLCMHKLRPTGGTSCQRAPRLCHTFPNRVCVCVFVCELACSEGFPLKGGMWGVVGVLSLRALESNSHLSRQLRYLSVFIGVLQVSSWSWKMRRPICCLEQMSSSEIHSKPKAFGACKTLHVCWRFLAFAATKPHFV